MISADWHPDDERLLWRCLEPEVADPTLDRHLSWCAGCRTRAGEMARDLDDIRAALVAETDAVFDAGRLASQRTRVLTKLGAAMPARVLSFPQRRAAWFARRWQVAAAVLLIAATGAGAARLVLVQERVFARPARASRMVSPPGNGHLRQIVFEESVFSDIDMALAHPRTAELRALDDFTPRVHEAGTPAR